MNDRIFDPLFYMREQQLIIDNNRRLEAKKFIYNFTVAVNIELNEDQIDLIVDRYVKNESMAEVVELINIYKGVNE